MKDNQLRDIELFPVSSRSRRSCIEALSAKSREDCMRLALFAIDLVLPEWEKENSSDKFSRQVVDAMKAWLNNPIQENSQAVAEASNLYVPRHYVAGPLPASGTMYAEQRPSVWAVNAAKIVLEDKYATAAVDACMGVCYFSKEIEKSLHVSREINHYLAKM